VAKKGNALLPYRFLRWSAGFLDLIIALCSLGKLSVFAPSAGNHSPYITNGTDYLHNRVNIVIFIFVSSVLSMTRAE
jgi:hypothetical protein